MQTRINLKTLFSLALTLPFILICRPAAGAQSLWRTDANLQLSSYTNYRDLNQVGFSDHETLLDQYIEVASLLRAKTRNWLLEAEPEFRALISPGVGLPQTDPAFSSTHPPYETPSTTSVENYEAVFNFKRFAATYSYGNFTGYLGRKPVSIGVLKVLPVWNKFTRPVPVTVGPKYIFGSDGLGLDYKLDPAVIKFIGISGNNFSKDAAGLLEFIHYGENIESHLLGGYWWEHAVAGLALAADISGYAIRFELLGNARNNKTENQIGFGLEAAFTEKLSFLSEFVYQSAGTHSKNQYDFLTPPVSRFLLLRAAAYNFTQLNYLIGSVTTVSAGGMTNCIDGSFYFMPKVSYLATESIEIALEALIPVGSSYSEFSDLVMEIPVPGNTPNKIGAPLQAGLYIKAVF